MFSQIIIGFLAFTTFSTFGETLYGYKTNSIFPAGRSSVATYFDGNDTVYLIGGSGLESSFDEVIKYSVSKDELEIIGRIPTLSNGGGIGKYNGSLYYITYFYDFDTGTRHDAVYQVSCIFLSRDETMQHLKKIFL
jgi:hypothetical protein